MAQILCEEMVVEVVHGVREARCHVDGIRCGVWWEEGVCICEYLIRLVGRGGVCEVWVEGRCV